MPAITINVNTGTFVQGGGPRRSPRLAHAGTVRVVPRLTVFTTSDAPVVPSRRTSPRLVAYYAEREAKRSRHAAVLELIDDVLAVAAKETPLQKATATFQNLIGTAVASGNQDDIRAVMEFMLSEQLMPQIVATRPRLIPTIIAKAKEFIEHPCVTDVLQNMCQKVLDRFAPGSYTIFYDPRIDKKVVCSCGTCKERLMEVILAEVAEFNKLFNWVDQTHTSSPERRSALLHVTARLMDSSDAAVLMKFCPVLNATVKRKMVEWMNGAKGSPSLQILCRAVLDKYFP